MLGKNEGQENQYKARFTLQIVPSGFDLGLINNQLVLYHSGKAFC